MTFQEALKKLLTEVDALVPQREFSREALDRFYALQAKVHKPIDTFLAANAKYAKAREMIRDLVEAVGEYLIRFAAEPEQREARRVQVDGLRMRIEAELTASDQAQEAGPPVATWDIVHESPGRFTIRAPHGATACGVPSLGMLSGALAAGTEGQGRYPLSLRPSNKQGQPGALILLERAKRVIVVGDLRGCFEHLVRIAEQTDLLNGLATAGTHLLFTGNAFHPMAGKAAGAADYQRSAALLTFICGLKARFLAHVHYLRGNFDHAHAGGITGGPGSRLDQIYRDGMSRAFNGAIMLQYQKFVEASPIAARIGKPPEALLAIHATVPYGLDGEDKFVSALMAGPRSKLIEDTLWSRRYDAMALQGVREAMGVRCVLGGHAPFPEEEASRYGLTQISDSPFAHREEMQMVISSHASTFGYLDIDVARPLPQSVLRLRAPDGRWAMRVIADAG